jgi:periplasmic divalent cation tolerance protein
LAPAAILVLTNLPDRASAEALARELVSARFAACVSIGAPVESIYHWQGKIEIAKEVPVTIKTRADRFADVAATVRAHHPYELPEIIAVPLIDGYSPYLDWIGAESRAP